MLHVSTLQSEVLVAWRLLYTRAFLATGARVEKIVSVPLFTFHDTSLQYSERVTRVQILPSSAILVPPTSGASYFRVLFRIFFTKH